MRKSLYQIHKEKWADGCGHECCQGARRCFARGRLPCDILFIGQGPGKSENVLGAPFVGPAGQRLDRIIERAGLNGGASRPGYRVGIANLVCCIPTDDEGNEAEPSIEQVEACTPRLQEFVRIANPRLIICVGSVAREWLDTKRKYAIRFHATIPQADIKHPSAILRSPVASQSLDERRCVVQIQSAVREWLMGDKPLPSLNKEPESGSVSPDDFFQRLLDKEDEIPF